jgi:flagellin
MQIQVEVSQLVDEINRIASHAQFNGMNMLTGRFARAMGENMVTGSMWFHIGANMDQRERAYIGTMTAQGLGVQSTNGLTSTATFISISTPDKANMAIGIVDHALMTVSKQRADLGAYQNRLEYTMKGLAVGAENLQASESRIRDADMAAAMVEFVRDQILVQSATAMLAQANTKPQSILQLFQ